MSAAYQSTVRLSFDVRAGLVIRQIHHWAALVFLAAIVAAPVPHLLHRRVPPAARDQLDRRRDPAAAGDGQRLRRLLAARRPAVGHRAADRLLGRAVDPVRRRRWLAFLLFGGQYPSDRHRQPAVHHPRAARPGGDRRRCSACTSRIIWRQKHTQFPGPGRREDNVVGTRLWPDLRGQESSACSLLVAGVLAALGGLAQINPVWLCGPYDPRRGDAPPRNPTGTWVPRGLPAAGSALGPHVLRPHHPRGVLCPASLLARAHLRAALRLAVHRGGASPTTATTTTCSTGPVTGRCARRSASGCSPSTSCSPSPADRTSSPSTSTSPSTRSRGPSRMRCWSCPSSPPP